jgi:hypothetical protein
VKNVWIIPQPLAGLLAHAQSLGQAESETLLTKNILSIDAGYGTVDWLFSCGLKPNYNRSGSMPLGMGEVIKSVINAMGSVFTASEEISAEHIDASFWKTQGTLMMSGTEYNFPVNTADNARGNRDTVEFDFTSSINAVTGDALTGVRNSAGPGHDIGAVLLMGGPHKVYLPATKNAYSDHTIVIVKNPLQAICLGLFFGALQIAQKMFAVTDSKTQ